MESVRVRLEQTLSGVGAVSKMGPVQVTEVDEKPGALLVRWEEVWHMSCRTAAFWICCSVVPWALCRNSEHLLFMDQMQFNYGVGTLCGSPWVNYILWDNLLAKNNTWQILALVDMQLILFQNMSWLVSLCPKIVANTVLSVWKCCSPHGRRDCSNCENNMNRAGKHQVVEVRCVTKFFIFSIIYNY